MGNNRQKNNEEYQKVWESIKCKTAQSNQEQDELSILKLLARDIAQIERFYSGLRKNNATCLVFAGIFGIAGVVYAFVLMNDLVSTVSGQINSDIKYIFVIVLGTLLLEILAGLCIWVSYGLQRQMSRYHDMLCDKEQVLLLLGIAEKVEKIDHDLKGELHKHILESEIKRSLEIAGRYKKET